MSVPYQPIENYGVVGNLRTVALVGKHGSIDWFCFPRFDSPSIFGRILDARKGGYFQIHPLASELTHKQVYLPETNVLVTRFLSADGVGEVIDYMPIQPDVDDLRQRLIRKVKVVRGTLRFRMECQPAFNYGRDTHTTKIVEGGAKFDSSGLQLALASDVPLKLSGNAAAAEFDLSEGQSRSFRIYSPCGEVIQRITSCAPEDEELFHRTVDYWLRWISRCTYKGRWREMVHRSALVLKLLTYAPTGAIVAAPTCSLPESLGGVRNWDYRYTWLRDTAFTIYSLLRIGFAEEATAFASFVDARCREMDPDGSLQTVYGIDGRHELTEETLDHLEGYKGSKPVRIGNDAYRQLQLDIYGELMDSTYLYNKYVTPLSYDSWVYVRRLVDWVCSHWRSKDDGIWEVRGGRQNFVYSKMMCWVAVDRALRLATKRSFPADHLRWITARDEIYEDIMQQAWNKEKNAFVQRYGSDALDASLLLMPLVFFVSPTDQRMTQTIAAINRPPNEGGLVSDGLVLRYDPEKTKDGLRGTEGTFNLCTFWLVEALTRASHENFDSLRDARMLFDQMLGYANHLGLYAEQTGYRGEALGNFPQALTHLSLISAAVNLNRHLEEDRSHGIRWTTTEGERPAES
jgi:GH15 family glucan-1,4-alpha-glucosidase